MLGRQRADRSKQMDQDSISEKDPVSDPRIDSPQQAYLLLKTTASARRESWASEPFFSISIRTLALELDTVGIFWASPSFYAMPLKS